MKNNFRQFSNILSQAICDTKVEWTNTYVVKTERSVYPKERLSYNELQHNIQEQLKRNRNGRVERY